MAQSDFGVINTSTTTGGDLATLLQNWRDAVLSNHSGTTRPSYVKANQIWVNTSATPWIINMYDGAADIVLGYVNATDDTAGFLTRALVTTKTASATIVLTERDMMVGLVASTANIALTLPAAVIAKNGFCIRFQKRDNTAYTVVINRGSTDLINGATAITLTQQYDTVEMISDGVSNWYAYGGILDGAVTAPKLAANSVTNAKIANNNVDYNKLDGYVQSVLVPTGVVVPFAGYAAPNGWILCYGQAISRTTFVNLWNLFSTTYGGGDGSTTFNLPDLRGRVIAGMDSMGGVGAGRIGATVGGWMGAAGGEERHVLTAAEMPSHNHAFGISTRDYAGSGSSGANYNANSVGTNIGTSYAGGNQPHNVMQPTLVMNYIIKW